jgi:hypothetical protein
VTGLRRVQQPGCSVVDLPIDVDSQAAGLLRREQNLPAAGGAQVGRDAQPVILGQLATE